MYDAFIGRKRSGKSYNVVATVILPALREGRTVVTNIPMTNKIYEDETIIGDLISFSLKELSPEFFNPDYMHKGAIYVIDEAHKLWSSGMQVTEFPDDQKEFITEHNHLVGEDGNATDLVLVTQCTKQLAAYPRNLLDKTYRCKKMDSVGLGGKYKVDIFDGDVALQVSATEFEQKKMNTYTGSYKPEVFDYYQSHTQNDSVYSAGLEAANDNSSIWKSSLFRYGLPASILIGVFGFYTLYGAYSKTIDAGSVDESGNRLTETSDSQTPVPSLGGSSTGRNAPVVKPSIPPEFPFSKIYRLSHYVDSGRFRVAYITDNYRIYPIPLNDCKIFPVYGLTCDFFGHLVNHYSGELPTYDKNNSSMVSG
ncbi:MAG: zona occludens toxin [Thiomicrorhabdus sp.]|nr:MAG: zona occludens toxin [Thiomicrorhabdus sp.]